MNESIIKRSERKLYGMGHKIKRNKLGGRGKKDNLYTKILYQYNEFADQITEDWK